VQRPRPHGGGGGGEEEGEELAEEEGEELAEEEPAKQTPRSVHEHRSASAAAWPASASAAAAGWQALSAEGLAEGCGGRCALLCGRFD
jgi:hypothetical protein